MILEIGKNGIDKISSVHGPSYDFLYVDFNKIESRYFQIQERTDANYKKNGAYISTG